MMGDGADRLAVIGMGWIGAYMVPCYRSLLGEGYEKRMFAVKAGSRGIEELRHRYGFEIIAGNCLDKLKEYKPGILVLSVRPHEVAGVAEDTIKPYVKYRREQGLGGLLLFSFAPSPRPEWYTRILGDGVRTVCILPAMETVIGGLDVYSLAFNKITYDPGCPPGREQLDAVRQFLKPLGQVFECTPDESLRLLSMSITYHMLYLLCFGLEPHYGDESGQGGCARAAGILYALNRRRLGLPGLITPAAAPDGRQMDGRQMGGQQMDGQQMDRLAWLEKGWYEGALAFAREAGGEAGNKAGPYDGREGGNGNGNETRAGTPGNADIIAPRSFELHLLSLQLETREFLEAKLKDHATPGGMTEEAVSGFRQLWTGKDWMEGDVSMAYDISYRLAERVYKKGKALEKRR